MANTLIARKRFGDEELDIREFIRPNTYTVLKLSEALWGASHSIKHYIKSCLDYVVNRIEYPPGGPLVEDWHKMEQYRKSANNSTPRMTFQTDDYWNFPSETLRDMVGDCDDKAILLTSLLRRKLSAGSVFCTVGKLESTGHMWVSLADGPRILVMETTRNQPPMFEGPPYQAWFRFNDVSFNQVSAFANIPKIGQR